MAGRFVIEKQIGAGGMGIVWRATDTLLERVVAIKQLQLPDGLADKIGSETRERALREARAAARLNHPAAVTVHDFVQHDGEIYVVMELVEAPTLQDVIEKGRLSPERVAYVGTQVAEVLAVAHGLGLVHRDIKPANLMLLPGDRVKVTDFGIARLASEPAITHQSVLLGSPAYMAPEQISAAIGASADWWSLGVTLYHAVEGHPPFPGGSTDSVINAVLHEEPISPQHAGPALSAILLRLLNKNANQRPGADAVHAALTSIYTAPSPPSSATGQTDGPASERQPKRTTTSWLRSENSPPEQVNAHRRDAPTQQATSPASVQERPQSGELGDSRNIVGPPDALDKQRPSRRTSIRILAGVFVLTAAAAALPGSAKLGRSTTPPASPSTTITTTDTQLPPSSGDASTSPTPPPGNPPWQGGSSSSSAAVVGGGGGWLRPSRG